MRPESPLRLEQRIGIFMRARMQGGLGELVIFVAKQCWAALFGILILLAIIATSLVWQADWPVARYDFLVAFAVLAQVAMLVFKLETFDEARVILLFHLTGTAMEWFKVGAGSWSYPEEALLVIGGVPLFTGFMYASVGSYIMRTIRIFHMMFAPYPPLWTTYVFGALIYINFFAHHFTYDIRLVLFMASIVMFGMTRVWFFVGTQPRWMPMPLAALLAAFLVWIAENIGTFTGTWIYAGQLPNEMVRLSKLGSWYLLLWVAFVTVTVVARDHLSREGLRPGPRQPPQER